MNNDNENQCEIDFAWPTRLLVAIIGLLLAVGLSRIADAIEENECVITPVPAEAYMLTRPGPASVERAITLSEIENAE